MRYIILICVVLLLMGVVGSVAQAGADPPADSLVIVQEGDILDTAEAWARDTWSLAATMAAGLVLAFSTAKTAFWFIVPDDNEDFIRNAEWRGLNFYSVGLLVVLYVIAWIAVVGQFDFNPWLTAPLEPLRTGPLILQNAASAGIITAAAIVEHEFITGIGPMFKFFFGQFLE